MKNLTKIYTLASGAKVSTNSAAELIEYLQKNSFDNHSESLEQYMFRVSERCLLSLRRVVRFDTPENFVEDLHAVGVIKESTLAN